jgi:hypothetical protein
MQVALKRFVDDIAIEVIEAKLMSPLGDIFSPVAVSDMSADLVTSIAGESDENRAMREQLAKQLDVLMKGSDTCKRFIGARLFGKKVPGEFHSQLLLMYWIDATDGMIQSDPQSNSDSTENDYSDSNEASDEDDVRSLSARSVSRRRSLSSVKAESSKEAEICAPIDIEIPEARVVVEVAPDGDSWADWSSHTEVNKKSKKSKVSKRRAVYES